MIKAVLFDLFGTLVDYEASRTRLAYPETFKLLRGFGFDLGHDSFVEIWDHSSRELEERTATSHIEFSMREAAEAFCRKAALPLAVDRVLERSSESGGDTSSRSSAPRSSSG